VAAHDTQLWDYRRTGVFDFNCLYRALADALETVLALGSFGIDRSLTVHLASLFLYFEVLVQDEFQKIRVDGIEDLTVNSQVGTVLAQAFAQVPLHDHLAAQPMHVDIFLYEPDVAFVASRKTGTSHADCKLSRFFSVVHAAPPGLENNMKQRQARACRLMPG
jgi:hypothetical protein